MPTMEQVIQPFQGQEVGPEAYAPPGGEASVPALVQVGLVGGTTTFTGDYNFQQTTKFGAIHKESSSNSHAIQQVIANPQTPTE
jgi:hypothetical protein